MIENSKEILISKFFFSFFLSNCKDFSPVLPGLGKKMQFTAQILQARDDPQDQTMLNI